MPLFTKFSAIKCPVCDEIGRILADTEAEKEIECSQCRVKSKASSWTICYPPSLHPDVDREELIRDLQRLLKYVKAMTQALDLTKDEVIEIVKAHYE